MTRALRLLLPIASVTLVAATLLAAGYPTRGVVIKAYAFALAALAVRRLLAWSAAGSEQPRRTPFDDAVSRSTSAATAAAHAWEADEQRAAALVAVRTATADAWMGHRQLRPRLRTIARNRLARAGIALDSDPRARTVLGEQAWDLLRPDRPEPARRGDRPLDDHDLTALADALERLEHI